MSKFDFKKIKSSVHNGIKRTWEKILSAKPRGGDIFITITVILLSCLVIIPSLVRCAQNRAKAACEHHMYVMLGVIGDMFEYENENGGTYWRDLIINGNYQKLLRNVNVKTGESGIFPSTDYYIRAGEDKLTIICKKHKDISEKEINLSAIHNADVNVTEKPMISEMIAYLVVTGPDTYYQYDSLDEVYHDKMIFHGSEIDDVLQNISVQAVYVGGYSEQLPRGSYTVTAEELDMTKTGQTRLMVKSTATSVWDNSVYAPFVIDIVGGEDVAPLIVDAGINGRYELAQWEWRDFVEEASAMGYDEVFGASIIRVGGKYYYYPDGLKIVNQNPNTDPINYALDTEDETKPAYYIEIDTNSVIRNSFDERKIHEGSIKADNSLIYIWQDNPSKELPAGWIRVYCELNKY